MSAKTTSWWRQALSREPIEPEDALLEDVAAPTVSKHGDAADEVSWSLRIGAAWSWRFLVLVAALGGIGYCAYLVMPVTLPVLLGMLLTLLLDPFNSLLRRRLRFSRTLSASISVVAGIGILAGALWVATSSIVANMAGVVDQARAGVRTATDWLIEGPLHLQQTVINQYVNSFSAQITRLLKENYTEIASSAFNITSSIISFGTTIFVSLFCLFFFLKDGRSIWIWLIRMLPVKTREPVHEAGIRGWITLKSYIKAQVAVAAVDAGSITVGAMILGVGPLALPLGIIIFIGCFIPIIGSLVTGAIAVFVVLVDQGFTYALIMLIIILVVNQVEGNLLQPFLMSGAVSLHPLAVVLSVIAGTYLLSIIGALFAVPIVAFVNTVILYLSGHDTYPQLAGKIDRVGGPAGRIHAQIKASYEKPTRRERLAQDRNEVTEALESHRVYLPQDTQKPQETQKTVAPGQANTNLAEPNETNPENG